MRAKAKKTPMCSVSLLAIELKGLAAPGEALNNFPPLEENFGRRQREPLLEEN